jgi:excisionase family DNA binding protein
LTPRQLADAIGVSESSVKRWVDDGHIVATRTAGGHRRIAIQEAARYLREHGTVVIRPDLLGLHDLAAFGEREETGDAPGERLFEYLKAGAAAEARGLVVSRYIEGSSVAEIVDGPIAYAMTKIGEAWGSSPSGIFWEHRATQIAIQAVSRLRLLLSAQDGAPVAVGGAPSGDRYILPSLAVAASLEGEGLQATNLGPETPLSTLAIAVEDLDARLVWLSVSVASDLDTLRREIDELVERLAARGAILVVGGSQASRLGLVKSDSVYVGRSMAELAALVQGMRLALSSPPGSA